MEADLDGLEGGEELRCRANVVHIRQSRPDSGHDLQVELPKTFQVVPSLVKD